MNKDVFSIIVDSCDYVGNRAKEVQINYKKIDEVLNNSVPKAKYWDTFEIFGSISIDVIVNFQLMFQAIDFSFWGNPKWAIAIETGEFLDGQAALKHIFIQNIQKVTDFSYMEHISFEEFQEMMKGNVTIPLLEERYFILKEVASIVNQKMDGNFYSFIQDILDDTTLFQIITDYFPSFIDIREYEGKTIYFYKLATLLTSDILHVRKIKENKNTDYSHLIGCSDYKIPQILRELGILEYSSQLSDDVDNMREIAINDKKEVEIRACTIQVLNYIKSKTNLYGIEVNDYIWLMSQKTKCLKPYHRTRTTNY